MTSRQTTQGTLDTKALSALFLDACEKDDAYARQCGRGVANMLRKAGLPFTAGDGHTWNETLPKNGWYLLPGVRPENAPAGAVVTYDNDPADKRHGKGGSMFGHVELVAQKPDGTRMYVSDAARPNYGGTVPHNFAGVFWHPSMGEPPKVSPNSIMHNSGMLAQADDKKKKAPAAGSFPYLQPDAGISIFNPLPEDSSGNSAAFNGASGKNPLNALMMLLAVAVAASVTTPSATAGKPAGAKPFG